MVGRSGLCTLGSHILGKHSTCKSSSLSSWQKLSFSSSQSNPPVVKSGGFSQPPLSQPLPNLPPVVYSSMTGEKGSTVITTLDDGLRIASENRFGQYCTVGVIIDSGSRYEVAYPNGISHFMEKLAFNSTTKFPNKDTILRELEQHGGICDSQSSRDTFIYATSIERRGLDAAMNVLGEVVLRPHLTNEEVNEARQAVKYDLEYLLNRPEQEIQLTDMIHAAAFKDNTLGLPRICPAENVDKIDRKTLFTYLKHHYTPERMVIAGVGVDHESLVECAHKYFVDMKPTWVQNPELVSSEKYLVDNSIAQYTGGIVQNVCSIPMYAGPSGLPELAHVVIGLESCAHQSEDFIPTCVLNMMMGGGGSFSAGGPGKGMYTRLYTNVLNRHHWIYSATAYNHSYIDSGFFCIHASAPPVHVPELVEVILRELVGMTCYASAGELQRAKMQLQSMLLMNLESRAVVFEDLGRQVLATREKRKAEYFIRRIEQVTRGDIERVVKNLLRSQPAVAARGEVQKMPSFEEIQASLFDRNGNLSSRMGRLSLFR